MKEVLKQKLLKVYDKFYYLYACVKGFYLKKKLGMPNVMSMDQTMDYILEKRCSVSRFGDGEFKLATGVGIRFQNENPELAQRLNEILANNESGCLVCISDIFDSIKWMMPFAYNYTFWVMHQYRETWTKLLDLNIVYGNAFISRPYMDRKDKSHCKEWFQKIKMIWNQQNIVFIEGDKSRLGYGNDLFDNATSIKRILCPSKHAFASYDAILAEAKKLPKDSLILLALGPTATVLAYDLHKFGYWAIDIGHIDIEYEWFLQKVTTKIPVKNKHTNEAVDGDVVCDVKDSEYYSQIIVEIK